MAERTVRITTGRMTLGEVVDLAEGASVELDDEVVSQITASRQTVDEAIARGETIYGVTTGLGHARDEHLPPSALRALQPVFLEMHVGAMGPALEPARVRAGLAVRLCGFARGGAGVSLAVALGLVALLNHRIHPVIPSRGSVGSGDLGQLALVGRVLLGRGEVDVDGQRLDAAAALAFAGLEPLTLEPKDALAIISSNALSIGHAALLVRQVRELVALADLVAAVSMEAIRANPSIIDPAVALARASVGQRLSSERMTRALDGSLHSDPVELSVQDPLSFRVVPQVHGACCDVLALADDAFTDELNAMSDNPLVDTATGQIISNGNFAPMNATLAVESLRVAFGHVGLLSERRMGHLWDAAVTSFGTPDPSASPPPHDAGAPAALAGLGLRYPAAARYTRLRQLAEPVSLDVPPLDLSVEDHSSNLAEALVATEEAAGIVEELLVIELLIATVLLGSASSDGSLGGGTERLVTVVAEELDAMPPDTLPDEVHRRVVASLRERRPHVVDPQDHPAAS